MPNANEPSQPFHATTILLVKKGGQTVIGGDGQVSFGQTVMKSTARKVRRLAKGSVIAGFAGATADAFTLFERLEAKLEQFPGQLMRASVELAKDWRTDRYLRRLEAMMLVADASTALVLTGTGDVLEPEATPHGSVAAIGSGGNLRAGGGQGADRPRHGARGHRSEGHGDRGRDLHLHQQQPRRRNDRRLTRDVASARRAQAERPA